MFRVCMSSFSMVALAMITTSIVHAGSITHTVDATFGDGDPDANGASASLYETVMFALPAISSLDSVGIQLAHAYGSDVELHLWYGTDPATVIIIGDDAPDGLNGQDDSTQLGDGAGVGVANVVEYTLVETGGSFPDGSGGVLASGTYGTDAWPAGSFPAGNWTLQVWDTWDANDPGAVGDVTLNYTAVPEPGTIGLAVLAMGGIFGLRRRNG